MHTSFINKILLQLLNNHFFIDSFTSSYNLKCVYPFGKRGDDPLIPPFVKGELRGILIALCKISPLFRKEGGAKCLNQ